MRNVPRVPKKELQRVPAGRELQRRLSLTGAEMQVPKIIRYRLVQGRYFGIYQEMMMSCLSALDPRGRDSHPGQSKMNSQFSSDLSSIL